jgi:hypothetical protein
MTMTEVESSLTKQNSATSSGKSAKRRSAGAWDFSAKKETGAPEGFDVIKLVSKRLVHWHFHYYWGIAIEF